MLPAKQSNNLIAVIILICLLSANGTKILISGGFAVDGFELNDTEILELEDEEK